MDFRIMFSFWAHIKGSLTIALHSWFNQQYYLPFGIELVDRFLTDGSRDTSVNALIPKNE